MQKYLLIGFWGAACLLMLIVFTLGLILNATHALGKEFIFNLIAMIFFFLADMLSIVNMLLVNNKMNKERQYR